MQVFYQIGIILYVMGIYLVYPFNEKARLWVKGRNRWYKRLKKVIILQEKLAWFHVSSLGEFEQGRPVIEGFKKKYPDYKILLTFFSPSGYEIRKNYTGADYICYLPADSKRNASRFLKLTNPQVAFFVKYDFWYHYLNQLNKRNIPTYLFSGIFRPKQLFFKWYGGWYRKILNFFTRIYVQNEESLHLLNNIGVTQTSIGGDTRFDRVFDLATQAKPIHLISLFHNQKPLIIAGSTWEKDETMLAAYIHNNLGLYQWIIAPHEVHYAHIQKIETLFRGKALKFSEANETNIKNVEVLIIDSIGILSSLYRYGTIAYIGGGFGKGIHNTLEAATYSLPVVFGPNYHRFREACDLIDIKAGFSIGDYSELESIFDCLLKDADLTKDSGKIASDYVNKMRGGTIKILADLPL
jgi:3-deoxy-D-manno-octulosonic-acid transferase